MSKIKDIEIVQIKCIVPESGLGLALHNLKYGDYTVAIDETKNSFLSSVISVYVSAISAQIVWLLTLRSI